MGKARHMDLSFSRSQSRFKDGPMIYRSQALEIHPWKQGCMDNIDFSCYILTDRRTLWPRHGRHMLGLNRRLCLAGGKLFYGMEIFWHRVVLKSCHKGLRLIMHAVFSPRSGVTWAVFYRNMLFWCSFGRTDFSQLFLDILTGNSI